VDRCHGRRKTFVNDPNGAVRRVAGAQAADLPTKAQPVEYVKASSLYGAGFWYVPGTDPCIKIGAFARLQVGYGAGGGGNTAGASQNQPSESDFSGAFTRTTSMF
jgi:hypothetical protein